MATKKMALIATNGTLDMAYPPFILASTAAALGWSLANPAMPMPVPVPVMVQVQVQVQVQVRPSMASMATLFNQITQLDCDESGYDSMLCRNTTRKH